MKLSSLWILLAFVPALSADVVTCNAGAASVPVFDTSSVLGAVGDYTLDCTGGNPTLPGQAIPVVNFTAFMNNSVPILNTGGWILTDGVNMTTGTFGPGNVVDFVGVPFDSPGAGHLDFTVENIMVNPSAEPPGFQFMESVMITGNVAVEIPQQEQLVAENAVPEPFTLVFVALGMGAMWLGRKRG
jgi:hypothetical protein